MRSLITVISRIAIASAIAEKAIDASTDDVIAAGLYASMNAAAMDALAAFPGDLNQKEIALVQKKITLFCDEMGWDHKNLHIHNYLIFSTEQLECVRCGLVAHNADKRKIEAIEKLIDIEADIYDKYADKGECPEFNIEGMAANDTWDKIFNA
ncbi:MAG: hypothetical protein WCR46_01185 [Deltaproteobacteria bacterium]